MNVRIFRPRTASPSGILSALRRAVRRPVDAASAIPASNLSEAVQTALYAADELPDDEIVQAAAAAFHRAAEQARTADRSKRAARKILDRLPAGIHAGWLVERVATNRQTPDLDAIRAIFEQHQLGPVPMKAAAPSLRVTPATVPAAVSTDTLAAVAL